MTGGWGTPSANPRRTRVEEMIAARREGGITLPSLDFTCTGDGCNCPHHNEENTDEH